MNWDGAEIADIYPEVTLWPILSWALSHGLLFHFSLQYP